MWPPCRKFLVKTPKKFCWISGNEEKLISLPKILFVKIFVWTCTTNFWQASRNRACKSTKDLFRSKSKNDSNAKFSKRSNFSFTSLLQKLKKIFIWARRMRLWPPCPKILVTILKTVCSHSGNDEKIGRLHNKVVSPQNVRQKCTMKFWQAWRNFVPKNTKKFPELQKCWSYNFFIKFFFRQRWFFNNVECNFDKASKSFLSKKLQICSADSENDEKIRNFLKWQKNSSKCSYVHVECSCDNPAKNFMSKLWKLFARTPEMMKNFGQQSCFSPKRSSNMHNEVLASLA